jgi:hypothetical protein
MAVPVYLEPQAKAVADANANPPYLFELGPDQGRRTIDAVQAVAGGTTSGQPSRTTRKLGKATVIAILPRCFL